MSAGPDPAIDPVHLDRLRRLDDIALSTVPPGTAILYIYLTVLPHRFFSLGTAAGLAGRPKADVRQALNELAESTLIERKDRDGLRWSIRDDRSAPDRASAVGMGSEEYHALLSRLVRYFLGRAAYAGRALTGPGCARAADLAALSPSGMRDPFASGDREARRQAAFRWLTDEYTNFPAVTEAAAENGLLQESWQLAEALMPFYRLGGGTPTRWASVARHGADTARDCGIPDAEARLRLDAALALLVLEQPLQAQEQVGTAARLVPDHAAPGLRGRLEEVRGRLEAAQDPGGPGALNSYSAAAALYAEAGAGERNGEARALTLASAALIGTSPARAADCAARAAAIADAAGDPDRVAGQALLAGGEARAALGQDHDAEALLRRAAGTVVAPRSAVRAWDLLADIATRAGDPGTAADCLRHALRIADDGGIDDQPAAVLNSKLKSLSRP